MAAGADIVVCDRGEGGAAVIVATDAFLASAISISFSLIVEAPSLPDCAIEVALGDVAPDLLSRFVVSTAIGVGRCTIFTRTSLSGTGGGGSDGRPFAVFVDVVERIEATDLALRGVFVLS